jgi:GT2 family glycosyltransferase/glycosyltransferase involved in cell wall biosynthesis
VLDLSPNNIEALLGLADLSMSDAQYINASLYYQQALQAEPQNLTALSGLAECSRHLPDVKKHANEVKKSLPVNSLAAAIMQTNEIETYQALVSIIIPVFNQLHYTKKCIEEIRHSTTHPHELIIVNNGSTDGTTEYLDSIRADGLKIKHNQENLGFVDACNQGAELAAGRYLVFLNNDTIPTEGWLESLVETAESDSSIGAVGAKLVYPDGVLQEAGSIIFSDGSAWNYGKGDHPDKPEYNYVRESPYCSAACLLIRRDLFTKIGGFDRRYSPAYWEDADLAFEVRKHGFKVVYQPAAEIVHYEGVTGGTDVHSGYKQYQVRNQEIFKVKWSFELDAQPKFNKEKLKSSSIQNFNSRILAIDHYLPVFDRNSGNHRAYQFMKLIRKGGHPLTFVARNGEYQSSYKRELEQIGIETYATDRLHLNSGSHVPSCDPIRWEHLLGQGEYKIAILSRYQNAITYLPLLRVHSPETKIVLDTVDVHFLREQRKADLYGTSYLHNQATETRKAELEVCKQADALIAVTEEDAAVLRKEVGYEKPIWVIPNIHPVEKTPKGFEGRNGLLFIGNFVHPPNSDAMYYFCNQILPLIRKKLPDIYLYIVGGNSNVLVQHLQSDDRVIVTGYVPSTKPFLDHCKLSVNPLRYGAGMKGKIGEAMAHGLPVITSPIGAEGFNLQPGTHALVEDSPEEFANAVIMAYSVESLWNQLSANGLKLIEERYSPEAVFPAVRSLLDWNFSPVR